MIIQHNMMANFTNRNLKINNKRSAKAAQKLSSGYRINVAADDAASLAISEKMRSQIRGLHQASANVEDGIHLFHVADGAMQEISDMVHRMRELCVQAANDTYTDDDRLTIQNEVDELCMEIDRISDETEFNTLKILNNSWGHEAQRVIGLAKVVGKSNITKNGYLSETLSTGNVLDFTTGGANATRDVYKTMKTTHKLVTASTRYISYDSFRINGSSYTGDLYEFDAGTGQYVRIGTASNGSITGNLSNSTAMADHGTSSANTVTNTWSTTSNKEYNYTPASTGSIANASTFSNRRTNNRVTSGNKNIVFGKDASGNYVSLSFYKRTHDEETGSEYFDYADVNETLASIQIDFKNFNKPKGFSVSDLYNMGFNSTCATCNNHYSVKFVAGTTSDLRTFSDNTGRHYTLDIGIDSLNANSTGEDLAKFIVDTIKNNSTFAGHYTQYAYKGNVLYSFDNRDSIVGNSARKASFSAGVYGEEKSTESRFPFYIQAGANAHQMIACYLPWVSCEQMGLAGINVMSSSSATNELDNIDAALDYLNGERTMVGAYVNRFEHAKSINDLTAENLQHAESLMRDADMANEMLQYTASNMLAQCAQAILAQANRMNEGILWLLQ